MKNTSKRWIVLLAAVCLVVTMTACGQGQQEKSSASPAIEISKDKESISVARPGLDIKIATIIVASQLGFFEEENLDVSFEQVADLATGLTAVSKEDRRTPLWLHSFLLFHLAGDRCGDLWRHHRGRQ